MPNVVEVTDFAGGLNLRDKPDAVKPNEATDLLNVVFDRRGAVAQREGYAVFTSSALTNRVDSLAPFYQTNGTKQLIAGCGTRLEAINASGGVVASATGLAGGPYSIARFGSAASEYAYCANGSDVLQRWSGAAWAAPTHTVDGVGGRTSPKPLYVAVQPKDNRLVAAGYSNATGGPNGATAGYEYVYFSEAGNPESWLTTNYVRLVPNDGEKIQGVCVFRDDLYVFKETKFFKFYGNTTSSTGQPVFNYTTIDAGVGLASPRALAVTKDGVYFLARNGVYRTTGSDPVLVSDQITPFFEARTDASFSSSGLNVANITAASMASWNNRIYVSVPTGSSTTNDRVLVYDPEYKWWSVWNFVASALCSFRISSGDELVFGYATGSNHVARHSSSYTNDAGTAISSRWRSGWTEYGGGSVVRSRQIKFWGRAQLNVGVGVDYVISSASNNLDFTGNTVLWGNSASTTLWGTSTSSTLWGPGPVVNVDMFREGRRGTVFQLVFENTEKDQSWAVTKADYHLAGTRIPGVAEVD